MIILRAVIVVTTILGVHGCARSSAGGVWGVALSPVDPSGAGVQEACSRELAPFQWAPLYPHHFRYQPLACRIAQLAAHCVGLPCQVRDLMDEYYAFAGAEHAQLRRLGPKTCVGDVWPAGAPTYNRARITIVSPRAASSGGRYGDLAPHYGFQLGVLHPATYSAEQQSGWWIWSVDSGGQVVEGAYNSVGFQDPGLARQSPVAVPRYDQSWGSCWRGLGSGPAGRSDRGHLWKWADGGGKLGRSTPDAFGGRAGARAPSSGALPRLPPSQLVLRHACMSCVVLGRQHLAPHSRAPGARPRRRCMRLRGPHTTSEACRQPRQLAWLSPPCAFSLDPWVPLHFLCIFLCTRRRLTRTNRCCVSGAWRSISSPTFSGDPNP